MINTLRGNMKQHGSTELSDNARVVRVITNSGPVLPEDPEEEQLFTLTDVGGNTDHQFIGGQWIDVTGSTGYPYDISVDAVAGIELDTPMFIHTAVRAFKLTGVNTAKASAAGASQSLINLVIDNGVTPVVVNTITFGASSTTGVFGNIDVVYVKKGDVVKLVPQTADLGLVGITVTLAGEILFPR